MAVNKVNYFNETLIDLTSTTATKDKIVKGFGAFGKDGVWMDGDYELNLQQKTVTPTTSTQVITADSGSVYSLNLESSHISSSGQRGGYYSFIWDISTLWITALAIGETYHINIDYYRKGYAAHYYYDSDYTFNGFPLSLTLSSASANNRTLVLTDTEIYVRASVDDDDPIASTLTYQIYKSVSYDGLSKVTVNPIPSNYIDTTDATASASDIRSGKSAYVNGSKVNGSLVVNKVYVGSTDPASSFGNDGDIYIKVV